MREKGGREVIRFSLNPSGHRVREETTVVTLYKPTPMLMVMCREDPLHPSSRHEGQGKGYYLMALSCFR